MLGSLRPLPPALPYWPLTEPKSLLLFAATLPPTVFGSCLVILDSIQGQNPGDGTKWNCRRKNFIWANPCPSGKFLAMQGPHLCFRASQHIALVGPFAPWLNKKGQHPSTMGYELLLFSSTGLFALVSVQVPAPLC